MNADSKQYGSRLARIVIVASLISCDADSSKKAQPVDTSEASSPRSTNHFGELLERALPFALRVNLKRCELEFARDLEGLHLAVSENGSVDLRVEGKLRVEQFLCVVGAKENPIAAIPDLHVRQESKYGIQLIYPNKDASPLSRIGRGISLRFQLWKGKDQVSVHLKFDGKRGSWALGFQSSERAQKAKTQLESDILGMSAQRIREIADLMKRLSVQEFDSDKSIRASVHKSSLVVPFEDLGTGIRIGSALMSGRNITGESMRPTLRVGDFAFVAHRAMARPLRRGDVILYPCTKASQGDECVKRVVGLAGDQVTTARGRLSVNGKPLNSVSFGTQIQNQDRTKKAKFKVPEGHFFLLGDNRSESHDSRHHGSLPMTAWRGTAFQVVQSRAKGDGPFKSFRTLIPAETP